MASPHKPVERRLASIAMLSLLLVLLSQLVAADAWQSIQSKVTYIICELKTVFASTASGVAAFVMVIACVQWISSESDPGVRKKAKTAITHAIVGMIIVMLADEIASLVIAFSCPT